MGLIDYITAMIILWLRGDDMSLFTCSRHVQPIEPKIMVGHKSQLAMVALDCVPTRLVACYFTTLFIYLQTCCCIIIIIIITIIIAYVGMPF